MPETAQPDDRFGALESRLEQLMAAHEEGSKRFEEYVRKTNKELKRARLKLRDDEDDDGQSQSSPVDSSRDAELTALRKLGRLETKLPEEVRAALEEQTEGMSMSETVRMYELASSILPKGEKPKSVDTAKPTVGRGQGPQNPNSKHVVWPKSQHEFAQLSSQERKELMKDDSFDPTSLPRILYEEVFQN